MFGDASGVLIAAPEPETVAQVRSWLVDDYRVETTTDGDDALARIGTVDAAVIDRELRTETGTVVATAIERRDAHTTTILGRTRVDGDQVGIGIPKSASKADLRETVDRLVRRARYDQLLTEYAAVAAERGAVECEPGSALPSDRAATDAAIENRLGELVETADELVTSFDGVDFRAVFATCEAEERTELRRAGNRS